MTYYVCNPVVPVCISLSSQLTEEHNEELREIREGYDIKLKEMEKVWLSASFKVALPSVTFSRILFDVLCLI